MFSPKAVAIAFDHRKDPDCLNLSRSTSAFVFFGVPNLGLQHDELRTLVHGQPNDELIQSLITNRNGDASPYLKELSAKFVRVCKEQNPKFELVSYYEKDESQTVQVYENKNLESLIGTKTNYCSISYQ